VAPNLEEAMKSVQWAPDGNAGNGIPSEIVRLLATEDGKTFGYGYGPGVSMVFGSERGSITVNAKQWVTRFSDGEIVVTDFQPHEHLWESCTCGAEGCAREMCAWCEEVRSA
jgi:hypothetical protein